MPPYGFWEIYYDTTDHGADYTAVVADATYQAAGRVYGFLLSGLDYSETYYVWVRYNNNGTFGDWVGTTSTAYTTTDGIDAGNIVGLDASLDDKVSKTVANVMAAPLEFSATNDLYDPSGGGTGTDTATNVAIALARGARIVMHYNGYIKSLFQVDASEDIRIGESGTGLIRHIRLQPGSGGNVYIGSTGTNKVLTTVDLTDLGTSGTSTVAQIEAAINAINAVLRG
jgi:hypothetical protein